MSRAEATLNTSNTTVVCGFLVNASATSCGAPLGERCSGPQTVCVGPIARQVVAEAYIRR
jgi:hypothetical protein